MHMAEQDQKGSETRAINTLTPAAPVLWSPSSSFRVRSAPWLRTGRGRLKPAPLPILDPGPWTGLRSRKFLSPSSHISFTEITVHSKCFVHLPGRLSNYLSPRDHITMRGAHLPLIGQPACFALSLRLCPREKMRDERRDRLDCADRSL